jgi:hypothetical protein
LGNVLVGAEGGGGECPAPVRLSLTSDPSSDVDNRCLLNPRSTVENGREARKPYLALDLATLNPELIEAASVLALTTLSDLLEQLLINIVLKK